MRPPGFISFVVFACGAGTALADTVKLKNGDTITGKVVTILDGKVTLKTDAAGEVKIDLAQVETLSTDESIMIDLANGTRFSGKAVAAAAGAFTVETESLGTQTVAFSALSAVNKPEESPRAWTGTIVGSATMTRGNTYTQTGALDINAVNRGEIDRLTFGGWYRAARNKDPGTGVTSTTERRLGAELKYDYFFSGSQAYGYGNTLAEKNAIAALDLRFVAGVGGGYQFVENDRTHFGAEGGISWFSENYSNATPSVDEAAVRVALHVTHKFSDMWSFFDDCDAYKVFGDSKDYLVHTKGGFREKLTANFFAQQWAEWYWDTTPAAGKRRQDVTYFFGIGWSF